MTENDKLGWFTWRLEELWHWLTEPAAAIKKPNHRCQARLLATLLAPMIAINMLITAALGLFLPPGSISS